MPSPQSEPGLLVSAAEGVQQKCVGAEGLGEQVTLGLTFLTGVSSGLSFLTTTETVTFSHGVGMCTT